jgi:hypothetical protein
MRKAHPRLHLVRGSHDAELYNQDLDWYYGVYDSECGLKSCDAESIYLSAGSGEEWGAMPRSTNSGYPVTDDHFVAHIGSFARARRVYHRLGQLPYSGQEELRKYYEPRQYRDPALPAQDTELVRFWHRAYNQMHTYDRFESKAKNLAKEDSTNRRIANRAEVLAAGLKDGANWFESGDYSALARYLLEGFKVEAAIDAGTFKIGQLEIIRWDGVSREQLVTISELARMTGIAYSTLYPQVTNTRLPYMVRGNKKLYSLAQLRAYLSSAP